MAAGTTTPATAPATPRTPDQTQRRPWHQRRALVWTVRVVTLVLILGIWEWYAQGKSIALIAPPTKVAQSFYQLVVVDQSLVAALMGSVVMMAIGLSLATVVAVPLGILMGRSTTLESVLDPYVTFLYVLPSVAFVPVLVVMVGIDFQLRLALIFLSAIFPILLNTIAGVKHVDRDLIDSGISFCASERQIMRTIVLPSAIPFIFAGFRIGFSAAWVGCIVAEMTAVITGVGGLLLESASRFRTADVFVAIFGIMAVAVTIQWFTSRVELWLTPWRRGMSDGH